MSQKGFYFDMTRCIGCKTCQIACKDKNHLEIGINFRRVTSFETGIYPKPGGYHYSSSCNHCAHPKCVENCPTGAMHKEEDGVVAVTKEKCIGCKLCIWSCPYGAPQYIEKEGKVGKCNLCKDLTEKGENPVCVDSCIMRAIQWGDLDELKTKYASDSVSDLPILPSSSITTPSILIKPKTEAKQKDYRLENY